MFTAANRTSACRTRRIEPRCAAGSPYIPEASSLDFASLDAEIDRGLVKVATDWASLMPYLLEMNTRLSAPGRRNDLRKGAPADLTWTAWVESKRAKLGRSLRTIQYLLKGKTEASKARQSLSQARQALQVSPNAKSVALEMASVAFQMFHDEESSTFGFGNECGSSNWLTPPELVRRLGRFDLDPCGCPGMPWKLASEVYTPPDDGLTLNWNTDQRVWLNPPYGTQVGKWAKRMADHGNGIMLVFGRTDTEAWQQYIWPHADAILFPIGRVHFYLPNGERAQSGTAPSSLIAYGRKNVESLMKCGIAGAMVPKAQMLRGRQVSDF